MSDALGIVELLTRVGYWCGECEEAWDAHDPLCFVPSLIDAIAALAARSRPPRPFILTPRCGHELQRRDCDYCWEWLQSELGLQRLQSMRPAPPPVEGLVEKRLAAYDALAEFLSELADSLDEWTLEVESDVIWNALVRAGLGEQVPYDPSVHGDMDVEPGDTIYVFTALGRRVLGRAPDGERTEGT